MSSRSLNKVMLIGNLTRDPESRYTPNQTLVCSFGLATNREWVSDAGERQSSVEYHNLVVWSKLAEICKNLLHKGNKVYVEGRLQTRDWQTKDGQSRRSTEIVVENMILLTSKNANADGANLDTASADNLAPAADNEAEVTADTDEQAVDDSDIPF